MSGPARADEAPTGGDVATEPLAPPPPAIGPPATTLPEAAPLEAVPLETLPSETAPRTAADDDELQRMLRSLMADDSVVAKVDGIAILWGDVWRAAEELPADYQAQIDVLFPALLRRAIDMALLSTAARRDGLQDDPAIRSEVAAYEERLLRERLLEQRIEERVTVQRLQALYQEHLAARAAAVDITARHIQLESREAAEATIADLDGDADFRALARERSRAASGKRGGELGTFRLDRMPPAFAAAVAQLEPGEYSREPVETEFGWHVILLEQRVGKQPPTFAALAPQLRAEAERRAVNELLQELRGRAQIEIMPAPAGN